MGQVWLFVASVELTVTVAVTVAQLSDIVPPWATKLAELAAGAGTAEAHCTVTLAGQVITGAVVSLTVMV